MTFSSFDDVYEPRPISTPCTREIVDDAGRTPRASTARSRTRFPGARWSPSARVRARCARRAGDVELEVVPGLSFADLAWARLGVDPLDGARVVDGGPSRRPRSRPAGPMLIAQCDTALVLSDVKLALLDHARPRHEVMVLAAPRPRPTSRSHASRSPSSTASVEPDHLTSLFVETGDAAVGRRAFGAAARAHRAAARAGRLPVGRRADAPLAHPLPARRGLRGRRGDRGAPARRAGAATTSTRERTPRSTTSSATCCSRWCSTSVLADGGRRVHRRRRRARDPRQARAPAPARVRRRRGGRRGRRRAQLGADQEGREGSDVAGRPASPRACPRCSTPTSCSGRRRRSGSTRATAPTPSSTHRHALRRLAAPRRRRRHVDAEAASATCSRVPSRSRARRASTPSPRCAAGRGATASTSSAWRPSRARRGLDLATLAPAEVDAALGWRPRRRDLAGGVRGLTAASRARGRGARGGGRAAGTDRSARVRRDARTGRAVDARRPPPAARAQRGDRRGARVVDRLLRRAAGDASAAPRGHRRCCRPSATGAILVVIAIALVGVVLRAGAGVRRPRRQPRHGRARSTRCATWWSTSAAPTIVSAAAFAVVMGAPGFRPAGSGARAVWPRRAGPRAFALSRTGASADRRLRAARPVASGVAAVGRR